MIANPQLDVTTPLTPGDAVAALIRVDGRYLLQLRDSKRGIFFPGAWGCFGGGTEAGETEQEALARELDEELGLRVAPESFRFFTRFSFDLTFAGCGVIGRAFYELEASPETIDRLQLGEGSAMRLFGADAVLTGAIVMTPYDHFALWLHINRDRLVHADTASASRAPREHVGGIPIE